MNLISIIIPFYNASSYLQRCLDSIITQDYHNLEIILVNDGSTDNSAEICEAFRQRDPRIKCLYEQHAGAGAALNLGLAASSGQYVMFISAHDFLGGNDNLSTMTNLAKSSNAEIVVANFFEFNNTNGSTFIHILKDYQKTYTPQEWFQLEYQHHDYLDQCFSNIYGKLFNRDLLTMVDFNNEAGVISDGTTWKIYLMANKIAYVNQSMYVIRKNDNHAETYFFDKEDHHSLATLEERIAILTMINFDVQASLDEYLQRLKYHRDHALDNGDYYDYLNAVAKLEIIEKNQNS